MTSSAGDRDPMDWKYELERALGHPALAAFDSGQTLLPEAKAAAYRVALCMGYCRLFRVHLPDELDRILPAQEAMAAADELIDNIKLWIAEARDLKARWDEAKSGVEEVYRGDLLEARMDAWAAYVAIAEAYVDCIAHEEPAAAKFHATIDQLLDALDAFDATLQQPEIIALLSTVARTPLLNRWRKMLGFPNCDYLPWWLDGRLERKIQRQPEEEPTACAAHDLASLVECFQPVFRMCTFAPRAYGSARRHTAEPLCAIQVVEALAAEPSDEAPPVAAILKWASPDGRWIARLSCPYRLPAGGRLPLEFVSWDGRPAAELADQPVWLAGQQEVIDQQGVAKFDLHSLRKAIPEPSHPITLEVGRKPVEWLAIPSQ